jgi:hypothetical protein
MLLLIIVGAPSGARRNYSAGCVLIEAKNYLLKFLLVLKALFRPFGRVTFCPAAKSHQKMPSPRNLPLRGSRTAQAAFKAVLMRVPAYQN